MVKSPFSCDYIVLVFRFLIAGETLEARPFSRWIYSVHATSEVGAVMARLLLSQVPATHGL